jgi:hypothetical protein
LFITEQDHNVRLYPGAFEAVFDGTTTIEISNSPTLHGSLSSRLRRNTEQVSMELQTFISDPTVEIFWCQPEPASSAGNTCDNPVPLGSSTRASGHHTYKFPQPSNNPTS